jgi:hypothetical protein
MAHIIEEKKKLLNRVRKIMGQVAEAKEVATLPSPQIRFRYHEISFIPSRSRAEPRADERAGLLFGSP